MPTDQIPGPGLHYRSPAEGIAAAADYPDAPISLMLEQTTPGADLFAVSVAIGGRIPLHYHSMMEFQFVISGTGSALDADGGETPISAGGTVLSPAGPTGAHGFQNTGPLPLTLLCIYPSPGGATPDRSAFDVRSLVAAGPRSVYVAPQDVTSAAQEEAGVVAACIIDERIDGAELYGVLLSVDDEIGLHHHREFELLYVLSGTGSATDAAGLVRALAPGGLLSCPAGPSGAHALRCSGSLPLQLLSVFPSDGGRPPQRVRLSVT